MIPRPRVRTSGPKEISRWAFVLGAILLLVPTGTASSQEIGLHVVGGHTEYEDLEHTVGLRGSLEFPWLGLAAGASWSRASSTRTGIPCAGLIHPDDPECVEQYLDVTGTMITASLERPITVVERTVRLRAVPTVSLAVLETERAGALTGGRFSADRTLLRVGLAAELGGRFHSGSAFGYAARLYGGGLLSSGQTCVDCFEPFRDDALETRISAGVSYRW